MTRPTPAELAAVGAPILYAPDEAAEILDPSGKLTGYWLLKRARSGEFSHVRVGRSIVFSPANLAEIARYLSKPGRPRSATTTVPKQRGGTSKPKAKAAETVAPASRTKTPSRRRGTA